MSLKLGWCRDGEKAAEDRGLQPNPAQLSKTTLQQASLNTREPSYKTFLTYKGGVCEGVLGNLLLSTRFSHLGY